MNDKPKTLDEIWMSEDTAKCLSQQKADEYHNIHYVNADKDEQLIRDLLFLAKRAIPHECSACNFEGACVDCPVGINLKIANGKDKLIIVRADERLGGGK